MTFDEIDDTINSLICNKIRPSLDYYDDKIKITTFKNIQDLELSISIELFTDNNYFNFIRKIDDKDTWGEFINNINTNIHYDINLKPSMMTIKSDIENIDDCLETINESSHYYGEIFINKNNNVTLYKINNFKIFKQKYEGYIIILFLDDFSNGIKGAQQLKK